MWEASGETRKPFRSHGLPNRFPWTIETLAEQRTVHFSGDVQGVGFRATTARLARGLAVTGTVRNLPDGRVELIVEGAEAEIDRLIGEIREYFAGHLTDLASTSAPTTDQFQSFRVAY